MKYLIFLIGIISLVSCSHRNDITKVSIGVSGAWSYGAFAISVDSSGKYQYYGRMQDSSMVSRYYSGKINHLKWDTLARKLDSVDFKKVDTTAFMGAMDVNYYELIVHLNNHKKRIVRVGLRNSDPVCDVLKWLSHSYKRVKLRPSKDTIKFETTYQNGVPDNDPNEQKIPRMGLLN